MVQQGSSRTTGFFSPTIFQRKYLTFTLMKLALSFILSIFAVQVFAQGHLTPKPFPYKVVTIGGMVWTAEDIGNARLYSESELNNACPKGWHVSTAEDWNKLFKTINAKDSCESFGYEYEAKDACDYLVWKNAGLFLKSKSFGGNDSFGFTVLPNGDAFGNKGTQATYWVTKRAKGENEWICFNSSKNATNYCGQDSGSKYLVRCVKD